MAKNVKKMEIRIGAKDKTKGVFKKIKNGLKSVAKAGAKIGAVISAGFGLAGVAFTRFTTSILDSEDALRKNARQLGITSKELASLKQAAAFAGIGFAEIGKAAQMMQRNIAEAEDGTAAQVDAFDKLGISVEEIQKLDTPEAMEKITIAMQGLKSQTDKTQVAMDIFGRAGAKLLNANADAFERGRKEAKLFGLAMDEVSGDEVEQINDNLTTIKSALSGFGTQVIAALSTPFLKASESVKALAESGSLKLWATQTAIVMVQAFQGVTQTVAFLAESINVAGRALNRVRQGSAALLGGFAAAELKLLEARKKNTESRLENQRAVDEQQGKNSATAKARLVEEIQQIETSIGKYRALADSSVDVFDKSGAAADALADKQGKAFAATDSIVKSLKETESELTTAAAAQEKLATNTETSKNKMTGLADETNRAATAMQRLVNISSNLNIPEGQRVLSGSGSELSIKSQERDQGGS